MGPGDLEKLTQSLPLESHPDLVVGRETGDDAGVVRLQDDLFLIQTLDFITPIVDDPYTFGAIAAANALSDVYAMGGIPLTAMNIACFPIGKIDTEILSQILRGGYDKTKEAGALLVGGHTVDDIELKYGLSVSGTTTPDRLMTNRDARPGDILLLTKPLGTGVIITAVKREDAEEHILRETVRWMLTLNDVSSRCAVTAGVKACTDITGFGLVGHAHEMAVASGVALQLVASRIPLLAAAQKFAAEGYCSGGLFRNRQFVGESIEVRGEVDRDILALLFDPQTSGGLLLACPPDKMERLAASFRDRNVPLWEIGSVKTDPVGKVIIVP